MSETVATEILVLAPNPANKCFGCGAAADGGMLLTFTQDNAKCSIIGRFVLGARYQGGGGMLHGGIIALLMDEAMGKVCRFRAVQAVTADITIEYLRPIPVDREIVVEAFETAARGRNLFHMCEIRDAADNTVLARARGRFVVLGAKEKTV